MCVCVCVCVSVYSRVREFVLPVLFLCFIMGYVLQFGEIADKELIIIIMKYQGRGKTDIQWQ